MVARPQAGATEKGLKMPDPQTDKLNALIRHLSTAVSDLSDIVLTLSNSMKDLNFVDRDETQRRVSAIKAVADQVSADVPPLDKFDDPSLS